MVRDISEFMPKGAWMSSPGGCTFAPVDLSAVVVRCANTHQPTIELIFPSQTICLSFNSTISNGDILDIYIIKNAIVAAMKKEKNAIRFN